MNFIEIVGQLSRGVAYTVMVTLACSATGVARASGFTLVEPVNHP